MSYSEDLDPENIACVNTTNFSQSKFCHVSYGNYKDCEVSYNNYHDCEVSYNNSYYCQTSYGNYSDCETYSVCNQGTSCGTKINYYVDNHHWNDTYGDSYGNSVSYGNYSDCETAYANAAHACTNSYGNYSDCEVHYGNYSDCEVSYNNAVNDCVQYTNYSNSVSYNRYNTGLPNAAPVTWSANNWNGDALQVQNIDDSEVVFEEIRANIDVLNHKKGQQGLSNAPFSNPAQTSLVGDLDNTQYNTMVTNLGTLYTAISGKTISGVSNVTEFSQANRSEVEAIKTKIDQINEEDMSARYSNTYTRTDPVIANYTETKYNV